MREVLERFSAPTREWFRSNFAAPTAAQTGAWESISSGQHTLVVAPTGSGKTLAAFLWAIDRTAASTPEPQRRCRVLYVSPLKALAVDVERNLRSPLVGIGHAAERLGLPRPDLRVAVRSGDTPAADRRAFAKHPADILITTPESLFLLLTSQAREALRGVETVILDEVHAVAGTKRGAHLALSLERLDALLERPAQRIGLSATVRPLEEVARYLGGGRPVATITPPSQKRWELEVVVPVPDLGDLANQPSAADTETPTGTASIWPHVEERIVDAIAAHSATLVFVNSRRLAERMTARLNELWAERQQPAEPATNPSRLPAEVMAQSGLSHGAPAVLARAHHGSVSREQRQLIEEDLKAGRLPAVVATSSLELGIDMGAVDLVIQVEAPPSVASGLQRVGRAGHQVGAVSHGVVFPKFRGDLVQATVITERMRRGEIEALTIPANPLDVLAQQIVAMVAMDDWSVPELARLVRRCAAFADLTGPVLESVLEMLAGRYPSEEFGELRPRLNWDRRTEQLSGRRGAQHLAVTSGGTIPDRGLFGVFLAGAGAGRRVGELDEEMVYESRVGDVIALGTSSWRIEDITHDQVLVTPAPGVAARLPFWKGDTLGRGYELGTAVGGFLREVATATPERAAERLAAAGLDEWASANLLGYLAEQVEAIGRVPSDRQLILERFRDELGDWRIVLHSPFGAQVHAPWALIAASRLKQRFNVDVQTMHADDGLVFRLPDTDWLGEAATDEAAALAELQELIFPDPDEVMAEVTALVGGSALFAARFRECAGRALLLPRRQPGRRQALWQQRLRASQLLEVASAYPSFPIVLETVRECVNDVFDVPGLVEVLRGVRSRQIKRHAVQTTQPSPFASSLLFGYVAQFLYEGDSPLAERQAAALSLDPALLAELLNTTESLSLAELLDPEALTRTESELQHLEPRRQARDADEVTDLLRALGPLTAAGLAARCREPELMPQWLAELAAQSRVMPVGSTGRWAAAEDAGRLRDAVGVMPPPGLPQVFLDPVDDPLGELLRRYARTHAVFSAAEAAAWLGLGVAVVRDQLRRLVAAGALVEGELRPPGWLSPTPADQPIPEFEGPGSGGTDYCDASVLRTLRRRSLASLRAAVEPVSPADFARFLPAWQSFGELQGVDGVLRVVEQLAGSVLPASALESLILPSRVRDYRPAMLDELTAAGEVVWQGHGAIGSNDGWISLHPGDLAPLTLTEPEPIQSEAAVGLVQAIGSGGWFFRPLADEVGLDDAQLTELLWQLVWAGQLSNDTLAPLRALQLPGSTAHRSRPPTVRGRYGRAPRAALPRRTGPAAASGRWFALPEPEPDPTKRTLARTEVLLDRYGVLTRGSVAAEDVPGGFAGSYRVLSAAEETGRVRRGYFVEGLGAAQFGESGAVDRLRAMVRPIDAEPGTRAQVLAATDPANPYGAALAWPARPHTGGHLPGRKAGALVVLLDGQLILYVERGGRTALSWSDDLQLLVPAATALAEAVHRGVLGKLTLERADGTSVLGPSGPLADALATAGFGLTPKGLRLRR